MKTKAKKFSHKLLALLMALVMGITCFSGVMTSFAATSNEVKYLDEDLEYNQLAWRMLSDEQTATAILDYLDDDLLPNTVAPMIENLLSGVNVNITAVATISYDLSSHILKLNFVLGAYKYDLYLNLNSVDEIIKTIDSLDGLLNNSDFTKMLPTLQYAHLTALKGMSRDKNTSCEILSGILGLLRQISFNAGADHTASNVQNDILGEVLRGDAVLLTDTMKGLLGKVLFQFVGITIDLDLYNLIGGFLNLDDGYESNLVYNVVKQVLLDYSGFFTAEEVRAYKDGTKEFKYDTILLDKLSTELLQKINVLVTYDSEYGTGDFDEETGAELTTIDNSINRKKAIDAIMASSGKTYEEACNQLGYDPNLKYSTEIKYDADGNVIDDYTGNILLFVYGDEKLSLQPDDSLMSFAYRALKIAWKTVLSGTVDLIHVNNSVDRGHGGNFDNVFYYWSQTHFTWNYDNVAANYSEANLNNWAKDVCESYGTNDPAEFLGWVKDTFEYDRTSLETSDGSWEDIDATTLFGKLRYSPMADYGFNMQTGPINLYFLQTGTTYLDEFFNSEYGSYGSITAGLNDCLVAAVKDIFAASDNVIGSLPELTTTKSTNPTEIATTLVGNALKVIEYTADATDENILKAFKAKYQGAALSEANLEEAMMPMLMACVGQVNLGDAPLAELIHPEDWNACNDAEGLAYLCLREYLTYVQPGRDYSVLVNTDGNGGYIGGTIEATLEGTIMPMARDALGYIMEPLVPLYDANNERWSATSSAIDDTQTTIFTLLNSVICYYANDYELKTGRTNGVAALLGICDNDGNSLIKPSNTIWENIDIIANHLLPVLGELQYGQKGAKLNSEDFVWNDIVLSFLEIGNIQPSGLGGVGNFIERFITMFTAPAVSETKVVNVVYNFLADLINAVFGVRYAENGSKEAQKFGDVIPATTSATPFDDLMQKEVLAGTDTQYNPGAIQKLIIRLAEASGYGGYGSNAVGYFPDSIMRGVAFAVNSVVSFVPSIFPTLGDSAVKNASASTSPSYITGVNQGSSISGTVKFKNNITGLNTAYVDEDGNVQRNQRYTVKLTNAYIYEASNPNSKTAIPELSNKLLSPGETVSASYTRQFYPSDGNTAIYVAEIHYDYVYLNGDPITDIYGMTDTSAYTDLIANAFQYVGVMPSWADEIYPNGQNMGITRTASGSQTTAIGQNTVNGTATLNSNLTLSYPSDFLITTADPMAVTKYTFSVYNKNSSDKGMDGIYPYDSKTVVNAYNGSTVTVNGTNAKLAHDDEGNAVIYGYYDYRIGDGEWQRNLQNITLVSNGTEDKYNARIDEYSGYTLSEINSIKAGLSEEDAAKFEVRDHVIFTPDELNAKGMLQAVVMENGVCTGLYIKSSTSNKIDFKAPGMLWDSSVTCYPYQYDTVLSRLCMESPIDGTYMTSGKVTAKSKTQTATLPFMAVADRNALVPGVYPISLAAYSGGQSVSLDFNVVIVDDAMKNTMQDAYNDFTNALAKYTPRDFADYDESTATSASYAKAVEGAKQALTTLSTPLTLQNRDEINSIYEAGVTAVTAAKEEMLASLDLTKAAKIVEQVSKVREPFNENNFNIITFNTMKGAAKDAENNYRLDIAYVDNGETVEKKGLTYEQYKSYRNKAIAGDITFVGATADNVAPYSVTSALSSAEITEYIRLFNFYLNLMIERGYIGNQIEAEIECAGGADYSTFEITPAVVDADGNITTNATVKNTTIADPQFGKYVDGVLVNEGDITYPAVLWDNYVNRLAKAVEIAQLGNGSYAHKEQGKYVVGADDYDANVTTCYTADSLLQVAEIALENTYVVDMQATEGGSVQMTYGEDVAAETFTNVSKVAIPWKDYVTITPVADEGNEVESLAINGEAVELDENGQYTGKITADSTVTATFTGGAVATHNVTGSLVIATNSRGATRGNGVTGDFTITVYDESGAEVLSQVFAMTKDNNTFSLDLAPGTYTAKIESGFAATRSDITIVVGDSDITGPAIPMIVSDFTGEGNLTAADAVPLYKAVSGPDLRYDLDGNGGVTAADAVVLYACVGSPSLTPVTIG